LVLDSGGAPGEIIVQGPAQDRINVTLKGKPAHAGVCPEEGISAIQIAAEAISRMQLLRIDSETTAISV
jgi:tripeptide aminopeptidase